MTAGAALAIRKVVAQEQAPPPVSDSDMTDNVVGGLSTEIPFHLVPKRERRTRRVPTPACHQCVGTDLVEVATRAAAALTWRCTRCSTTWEQRLV